MSRLHRTAGAAVLACAGFVASAAAQESNFGSVAAASGRTVFVGEPMNRNAPGAVYVYDAAADGSWRRTARLTAGDSVMFDGFGRAIAVDGSRLAVGAVRADGGRGAVFVFERGANGDWRRASTIAGSAAGVREGANFGQRVALAGDQLAIAAPGTDSAAGAVYLFRRSGDRWVAAGTVTPDSAAAHGRFGAAIALHDGRLLIGAPAQDSMRGAVHLYRRAAERWEHEASLTAPIEDARLGSSLAVRDGDVYAGAPGAFANAGAVVVFTRDTVRNRWVPARRFMPFGVRGASLGTDIAFAGRELWAAAPAGGTGWGSVFRFWDDSTGAWTAREIRAPEDQGIDRRFAQSLATGDGVAVVGLPPIYFGGGAAVLLTLGADGWQVGDVVRGDTRALERVTGGKVECRDGRAGVFGCRGVELLAFVPVRELGGEPGVVVNDLWGWTDPETGREYALVGRSNGTAFVDVTNPSEPRYLGSLPMTATANANVWRDVKVYRNHAYIVADGSGRHGMQVFDLTRLRDVRNAPATFTADAVYDGIWSAHNVVIDTVSGFAFAIGANGGGQSCAGALHMVDIRNPAAPTFAGCFADRNTGFGGTGRTHDAQCVTYAGPAEAYRGRQLCFSASENALGIADVTDKARPVAVGHASYPSASYAHQGWLTDDHRYFYMNDEGDEVDGKVKGTRTIIWDVADPTDPVVAAEYVSENKASDHNLYIRGDRAYLSNYLSGLRVLDISDPTAPREVGFFDTVPGGDDVPGFAGSWSNYPFFASGTILVSSTDEGLFLVRNASEPLTP